jgi:hypothetical protein
MTNSNKYWIVFVKDEAQNANYVELVYCENEKEALKIGSKILNMNEDLLDTFEKELHIRKRRSKNVIQNQQDSYWFVYVQDVEVWDGELIFCDTSKNAIKSTMYIRSITRGKGILAKQLTLYVSVDNFMINNFVKCNEYKRI